MPRYLDEIIKAENAMAVFKAVVDNKCETRADISGFTGLSVVTVNKAVEVFLNKGIFVQKDIESNAVGRHASHVFLDPTKILALVDISNRDFEFRCYDLGFNQVYSYRYRYMDDFTYKDNIRTFFYRVKAHMLDTLDSRYLMIGLIVPGTYDRDNDKMVNVDDYNKENINLLQKFL